MSTEMFLPAGRTLRRLGAVVALFSVLLIGGLSASGQDALEIKSDDSAVSITAGEGPVLRYQCVPRPRKLYVKEWFSPGGVNVLRDAPADHLHHHGLMFAVAVDGVDFWSENDKSGRQQRVGATDLHPYSHDGLSWCAFSEQVDWAGPDAETVLLRERRTINVCRMPQTGPTFLAWRCRLEAPPGKQSVTLSGSPYFGLGMRFVESMDTGGRFQNADGKTGVEGTNEARSTWCAYWAAADGKPVTVAMFDCPKNPRHPATWFTMDSPFAYLAATLHLYKKPLVIKAGKPLELLYAAALWDGHAKPQQIEKVYGRFIRWASESETP